MDEFLQDLDEDVEGMQSTIYYLQQELRKTKDNCATMERELITLRSSIQVQQNEQQRVTTNNEQLPLVITPTTIPATTQSEHLNGNCNNKSSSECARTQGHDSDSEPELIIKVSDKEICGDDSRDIPSTCSVLVNGNTKRTYDSDSNDTKKTVTKKVRRSSVLSLEFNEDNTDDDALIISTNGDGNISDAD